jgi:hypothetical protein
MNDSKWANPYEDDFKKKVVKFRNSSEIPKSWAVELKDKIVKSYSIEEISKTYNELLKEYMT